MQRPRDALVNSIEKSRHQERSVDVWILEGAGCASELREHLIGTRSQSEVADNAGNRGDERGPLIGVEDQLGVSDGPLGDEGRKHECR